MDGIAGAFMVVYFLLMFVMLGISIYCFVLFIKLARRGITALDIYIDKNNKPNLNKTEV